ncbi:MAG: hypothetical protein AB7S54_11100, partial [Bacteroidales bacterium]
MNSKYQIENFERSVKQKFEIYNSIFLGLPLNHSSGNLLQEFSKMVNSCSQKNLSPKEITDQFAGELNQAL